MSCAPHGVVSFWSVGAAPPPAGGGESPATGGSLDRSADATHPATVGGASASENSIEQAHVALLILRK